MVNPIRIYTPTSLTIADKLLGVGAIQLNEEKPFVWSSGWKSPIYCDNRISLSYPAVRTYIRDSLVTAIKEYFGEVEYIAGVATAGIPHGALVADTLRLPYVYVRSKPKMHGMGNQIEGRIERGKKVVLIEDLISTGGSLLTAVDALDKAGFIVVGLVAIFTYGLEVAEKNIGRVGIPLLCLSDFDHLLNVAVKNKYLTERQLVRLRTWRLNPDKWE